MRKRTIGVQNTHSATFPIFLNLFDFGILGKNTDFLSQPHIFPLQTLPFSRFFLSPSFPCFADEQKTVFLFLSIVTLNLLWLFLYLNINIYARFSPKDETCIGYNKLVAYKKNDKSIDISLLSKFIILLQFPKPCRGQQNFLSRLISSAVRPCQA